MIGPILLLCAVVAVLIVRHLTESPVDYWDTMRHEWKPARGTVLNCDPTPANPEPRT